MKKTSLIIATLFLVNTTFAQQEAYDALLFSQPYYFSTARSAAMGGASGALGSEMGAIAVNPAAIVTYKTNELIFTPEFYRVESTTNYYDQLNSRFKNGVNINNAGVVFAIQPRRSSTRYNIGFAYNKQNFFNANERINAPNVPSEESYIGQVAKMGNERDEQFVDDHKELGAGKYLFNQDSTLYSALRGDIGQRAMYTTTGHVGEYALSFGANISEKIYLGASFIVRDSRKSFVAELNEESVIDPDYRYSYNRTYNLLGLGFGGRVGILILPIPEFSIGLSLQVPTFYSFTKRSEGKMIFPANSVYGNDSYPYEPENEINYNLVTPLQLALSLGYVFPEVASLTFDCEMTPYGMARYSNTEGDAKIIDQNNDLIKAEGKVGGAVRLGSEFYVWKGWIARLGAGYHTASSTWIGSSFNIGAGAGYNFGHALIDLSYVYQSQNHEYYSLYNGLEQPVAVKTTYIKQFVALSLAYRF